MVVLGVIGIVAFGSINSGLTTETDVAHLTYLWRRGGWLGFFFAMSGALIMTLIFTARLDAVLAARSDLTSVPFSGMGARAANGSVTGGMVSARRKGPTLRILGSLVGVFSTLMTWISERLEDWTAPKDDKTVAWTLGIGWACCGGGLAGGTLVFAKAT